MSTYCGGFVADLVAGKDVPSDTPLTSAMLPRFPLPFLRSAYLAGCVRGLRRERPLGVVGSAHEQHALHVCDAIGRCKTVPSGDGNVFVDHSGNFRTDPPSGGSRDNSGVWSPAHPQ